VHHRIRQVLEFLRAVRPTEDAAGLRDAASRAIRGFGDLKSRSEIEPVIGIVGQYRIAEAITELRDAQQATDPTFRIDDAIRWIASALDPNEKPPGGSAAYGLRPKAYGPGPTDGNARGSAVRVGPRFKTVGKDDPRQAPGVRAIRERTALALHRLGDQTDDITSVEHAVALLAFGEPVIASFDGHSYAANPDWVHDWQAAFDPHQRALIGKARTSLVDDGAYAVGEAIDDLRLALEEL
jgi:hypothetical protein